LLLLLLLCPALLPMLPTAGHCAAPWGRIAGGDWGLGG